MRKIIDLVNQIVKLNNEIGVETLKIIDNETDEDVRYRLFNIIQTIGIIQHYYNSCIMPKCTYYIENIERK